jgi:hypothetical protein
VDRTEPDGFVGVPRGRAGTLGLDQRVIRPVRLSLVVGEPLWPEAVAEGSGRRAPRRAVRALTDQLRTELQSLFDTAQARVGRG